VTKKYGSIPSLDGWRAIAIILVVLSHSGFEKVIPGGLGVTIFFFLSGYLITSLMRYEVAEFGRLDVFHFYVRRFARLMPTLIVSLSIAYTLVLFGVLGGGVSLWGAVSQLLYFCNYYILFFDHYYRLIPDGTNVLWSLAVEEHFYIIYPLVFVALHRVFGRKWTILVFLLICVVILLRRVSIIHAGGAFSSAYTYCATDTRLDSILWGGVLALVMPLRDAEYAVRRYSIWRDGSIIATSVAVFFVTFLLRGHEFRETYRYTLQSICLFPLFYYSVTYPCLCMFSILNTPLMRMVGRYSYAMYLFHYSFILYLKKLGVDSAVVVVLLTIFASIAYAVFIDRFVDSKFLAIRKKFRQTPAARYASR